MDTEKLRYKTKFREYIIEMMFNFKKLLEDQFIPVIIVFSILIALVLTSKIFLPDRQAGLLKNGTTVLGASDPPTTDCQIDQCGACNNCGGVKGISCGQASRCIKTGENFSCRFDLSCL